MSLVKTIKNLKKAQRLVVTPRIEQWLVEHPEGLTVPDDLLPVLQGLVAGSAGNADRGGRFGASSRGTCQRAQVFTFLRLPRRMRLDPQLQNIFNDGTWRHIRWQMMGLVSKVFTHVEVPFSLEPFRLKVSADALNADEGWGFELKGESNYGIASSEISPAHNLQVHSMMLASEIDRWVYIAEDKRTQQWREIVITKDPLVLRAVKQELNVLNESIDNQQLPKVLPECRTGTGATYRACPYADNCLKLETTGDTWPGKGAWPEGE